MLKRKRRRIVQLGCLVAVLAVLWALGVDPGGMARLLWAWMDVVTDWARDHPVPAAGLYVLATTATKIAPFTGGGTVMVLGGYVFGALTGGVLSAAGATLSATLVCLLGRRFLSELILDRWGDRFARIEEQILAFGFSYYLALRLLPLLPAWLVNLVPVVVPLPLSTVAPATFVGVLPISFVMASLGSSVSEITEQEEELSFRLLLDPGLLLPLAGLSLIALLPPLLLRRLSARRRGRAPHPVKEPSPGRPG